MRTLAIRPGAIGDLIVSLPALEYLRAEYLEVWVAERNVPLIRFADAVHSIGSTGLDLLEIDPSPRLIERLRGFDSIVSWYGTSRRAFREVIERFRLPFQFFPALPADAKIHAVDFYVLQVTGGAGPLACGRRPRRPTLDVAGCPDKPGQPDADREIGPAVIHPFASSPRKRWPLEKFREVARLLPIPVQWCAGPEEPLEGAVRIDNLYELGCWLSRAQVYIGNDSGISHLAAAVGTPVIALFGPTNPEVWAPRGSQVLAPLEGVEPADVVAAVEAISRVECRS